MALLALSFFAPAAQPAPAASALPRGLAMGINYEGPADRAWNMWPDDQFDPSLIDADFQRAQAAGAQTLRIFVQTPLATDVAAGKWTKLDQVVALAQKRNLGLILTLHDYTQRDVGTLAATARQIAAHEKGQSAIVAYDVMNEPHFGDLAQATYPTPPPLQTTTLIDTYQPSLPRDQVPQYRATDDGQQTVPAFLSDDQAYVYVNNLRYYIAFLSDGQAWVTSHPGMAFPDYMRDPASSKWSVLMTALNATLVAWLQPQLDALHQGDPSAVTTVGYSDPILASLAANDALSFQTVHSYPAASAAGINTTFALLDAIRRSHPQSAVLLGEYGYANDTVDPATSATLETALALGIGAGHEDGAFKWMLNDLPPGNNTRQRTLGLYGSDGTPKPAVGAFQFLSQYLTSTTSAGTLNVSQDGSGVSYVYQAPDALLLGGSELSAAGVSATTSGPGELFLTWAQPSGIKLWASAPMQVSLDLGALAGVPSLAGASLSAAGGQAGQSLQKLPVGGQVVLNLTQPGGYRLTLPVPHAAGAADYDMPGGHFFTQAAGPSAPDGSGYSVTDADGMAFWTSFQQLGGVQALGYPASRRFPLDGFTVQVFQKAVLQWHPDQKSVAFLNTFDLLHDRGKDGWLQSTRMTPPPADTKPDQGLAWDQVQARHLAILNSVPAALKDRFLSEPDWLDHFGLPVSEADFPDAVVVRTQRAVLQYWKHDEPWAAAGQVTVANGGDIAKEAGVWPAAAITPEPAP